MITTPSRTLPSLCLLFALIGCATAPKSAEGKAELEARAAESVRQAEAADPTLAPLLAGAAGYAVFPNIGKGGLIAGGAYGKGVLYEKGVVVGYCDLTQGTIGLQAGGQAYTEIIAFSTREALDRFRSGNFAFGAQVTAVAVRSGAGRNARYEDGVAVFTSNERGLMAEAAVGGQKFSFQAK
jgi:lipid-binding SYLF domain-containing protein